MEILTQDVQDARGFVVGDDVEQAFACTMISLWEGARA
jgi:hypothetical protein